jgi:hypothetical protein
MLKSISNLGSVLSKAEQKSINGGWGIPSLCTFNSDCWITINGVVITEGICINRNCYFD